ncbi:MAG: TetR/AcrR family transcriptional regulator [Alphaproteobacteria bacterium]|nr:TetR/AcrR family transcriptional regulator [Alphaproteobacteria bacterium]
MAMEKENIQNLLLRIGRKMVQENGTEALTVRKLSEASGCSVGAIYNQFSNMDNFVLIQNYMTLEALAKELNQTHETSDAFADLNKFLEIFVQYVLNNKNLWHLLYRFHLNNARHNYTYFYMRQIVKIIRIIKSLLHRIVPQMERPERALTAQILWMTIFALSSLLTNDILDTFSKVNKKTICQLVVNTYIAGLSVLEGKK